VIFYKAVIWKKSQILVKKEENEKYAFGMK